MPDLIHVSLNYAHLSLHGSYPYIHIEFRDITVLFFKFTHTQITKIFFATYLLLVIFFHLLVHFVFLYAKNNNKKCAYLLNYKTLPLLAPGGIS